MLHNLIDNYKKLKETAYDNHKLIGKWFDNDVPREKWDLPCYENITKLVKKYHFFSIETDILNPESFTSYCEYISDLLDSIENTDQELIPQPFLNAFIAFHDCLIEFKDKLDHVKDDPISNDICVRAVLEAHIKYLCKWGHYYQLIERAAKQALAIFPERDNSSISVKEIVKLDNSFEHFKMKRVFDIISLRRQKYQDETEIKEHENKIISSLTKYLITFPCKLWIEQFKEMFIEHQYVVNFAKDKTNLQCRQWGKIGFFSEDEEEHHKQLAPVLNEINKMVKKF